MGAYSPAPVVTERVKEKVIEGILKPTLKGLTDTVSLTNDQLTRVDSITSSVTTMTTNASALTSLTASTLPAAGPISPATVGAAHTPDPSTVTLVGSLQSELGCPGDWDPSCLRSWPWEPTR
jgi:hypothetical protein